MPPKASPKRPLKSPVKLKTEPPTHIKVRPVEEEEQRDAHSKESSSWEDTQAHHLLHHSTFKTPPRYLLDLFVPLTEYYAFDKNSDHPSSTPVAAALRMQVITSLLGPKSVVQFRARHLLSPSSPNGDGVPTAKVPPPAGAAPRKRAREEGAAPVIADDDVRLSGLPAEVKRLVLLLCVEGQRYLPPCPTDNDYLTGKELDFVQEQWLFYATTGSLTAAQMDLLKDAGIDYYGQFVPCLSAILALQLLLTEMQLRSMRVRPRVLRVVERLGLTPPEVSAFVYILLNHCGFHICANMGSSPILSVIAAQTRLRASEVLYFLNTDRIHMKQGLICISTDSIMDGKVTMPVEVVTALSGATLAEEQAIKLQGTVVLEVLGEDRLAGTAVLPPASASREGKGEEEGDDEDEEGGEAQTDHDEIDETVASSAEASTADVTEGMETPLVAPSATPEALAAAPAPTAATTVRELENGGKPADFKGVPAVPIMELKDISPFFGRASHEGGTADGAKDEISERTLMSTLAHVPYKSEVEFMEEAFKILALLINIRNADGVMKDEDNVVPATKSKMEVSLRSLKRKVRVSSAVHQARLEATLKEGHFIPRVEQLSRRLGLSEVEKLIVLLMVGTVVSHDVLVAINGRYVMRDGQRIMTVGYILFVLCEGLMERVVGRKAFYRSAPLITNGILTVFAEPSRMLNTDLMEYYVDIDRTIVDSLMGMGTETSEIVPGSQLYMPSVPFEHVALPTATTNLVLSTIEHYSLFEKCKKNCGFSEKMGMGNTGLVILFYGPSGTGKTMLANAVAHNMKKRILVVNFSQFKSEMTAPAVMRFLFREAKLNDAIIFFDECETLFETRENNPLLTSVLTEFEKYDGIVLMSTNCAQKMDDAMNRRISLMIEFKLPDRNLRKRIWTSHVPTGLKLADNVSLEALANNYELSGGLIRNAVLAAIRTAVARENTDTPTLTAEDFDAGARQQLRGFFLAAERQKLASGRAYITPKRSLAQLVVEGNTRRQVELIARSTKCRTTLFSQWGFNEETCENQGALHVFHGPSGTGKSLAVEGIAYECGAIVRVCNIMEQILLQQNTIREVFDEGHQLGAIIVFDEGQQLFDHTDRSQQIAQLIYYHAVQYPRPVIIIATTPTNQSLDVRAPRLKFTQEVAFHTPNRELRETLWRKAFPPLVPRSTDIDFAELSTAQVSAKLIDTVVFNACSRAVMETERQVTMKIVKEELELAMARERNLDPLSNMFA